MDYILSTPCGEVRGAAGRVPGTVAYKGIRYATAGRWEHPVEVTSWEGVYDATAYGHCSYQPRSFYDEEEDQKKIFYYNEFRKGEVYTYSEDCLFLNIFTPGEQGEKRPVLVYIHGGGFTGGCGHEKHFDGPVWPVHGVIGVTINYRLGPMGFAFGGNYGLYDQMTALQWVKHNIASFGGDPENITVMGQSAGAMSVQLLCQSPLTEGLFQKAVMSSGGGMASAMAGSAEKNAAFWEAVMERCGCESLEAFKKLPPEEVFAAWQRWKKELKGGMAAFPAKDGIFITEKPQTREIPYMLGSTSHDMAPPVLQSLSRSWCAKREKPSYTWYFSRMLPGDENGAWHSADLWYWFGTLPNCWRPMEDRDRELSDQMVRYLCNFAKTGDPNKAAQLPTWIASGKGQGRVLILGDEPTHMGRPSMAKMIFTMLTNKAVGE